MKTLDTFSTQLWYSAQNMANEEDLFILYEIYFKKEGLPSCSECFNFDVRHLGTFVNSSHNWYTVSPLPKS